MTLNFLVTNGNSQDDRSWRERERERNGSVGASYRGKLLNARSDSSEELGLIARGHYSHGTAIVLFHFFHSALLSLFVLVM